MVKIIAGADEAGRGPVLGPLVIAGAAISENKLDKLKKLGVKDSKLLTPKQRNELFKKIIKLVDSYEISITDPQEIDSRNAVGTNLNRLEAIKVAELINQLRPHEMYVDSPTAPDGSRFKHIIRPYLEEDVSTEIYAGHKFDIKYPIVSAASIIAKVTRDRLVKEIEKEIGCPIGSGYPADPICQEFLKNIKPEHEKFLRKCWTTYQELKKGREQRNLGEF